MFSPLRNRFGIPGAISVIALVFAMLGGAYAASNNGGGGKATASAKAKKGPRGPRGPVGPAGPAGPAGPQGPAGANGKDGANGSNGEKGQKGDPGTNGTNGTDGTDGESPEGHPFTGSKTVGSVTCNEGGVLYEVESTGDTQLVCNGNAAEYPDHLLPGKTETGPWSFDANAAEGAEAWATIGFQIPLSSGLDATHVHFQGDTAESPGGLFGDSCGGNANAPQVLLNGNLCVFKSLLSNATAGIGGGLPSEQFPIWKLSFVEGGASTQGVLLIFTVTATGRASGFGVWALKG